MLDLSLSAIIFSLSAMALGVGLGWWISHVRRTQQDVLTHQELDGLRNQYDCAVEENNRLRQQLKQVEENRAKAVSLLDASNDYGYFLETRKALEDSRKRSESHLKKLQEQEQHIIKLTSIIQSIHSEHDAQIGRGLNLPSPSDTSVRTSG
ncbi:MAG: hypothetical protein WAQ53_08790 [Thiofilum sp.]|uniref:hypothetical protein n=1 Tax=Thiofilum sp. TaxID=2212733 RepID=UPI0025E4E126|nr:hypothetical protein [Thiofilum sp.]MBK8452799.1 hypothetical protein [Thiofilum sp.]